MTKAVGFSLKVKIILLICTLLLAALGSYAWFAIDLFREDKTAYVYEASLNGLEQLEQKLQATVQKQNTSLKLIQRISSEGQQQEVKNYIDQKEDILAYAHLSTKIESLSKVKKIFIQELMSDDFVQMTAASDEQWRQSLYQVVQKYLQSPPLKNIHLLNPFSQEYEFLGPHILSIGIQEKNNQESLFVIVTDLNSLTQAFSQQRVFDYVIKDNQGSILPLVNTKERAIQEFKGLFNKVERESTRGLQSVQELKIESGERFLVAHQGLGENNIEIMSVIAKEEAFSAANYLVKQSFIIALLILSFTIMVGILFSQTLTRQLEKLYLATLKIAQGDFESKVEIRGSDEISSLGRSFNFMSEKILVYIQEMKEKNRLENELAVAKLVQDSFFPPNKLNIQNLTLASFYTPATECGGDWWGYIESDEKTIIIVADATGHGVPAAFLTATVHSCIQTLEQVSKAHPEILSSPDKVLDFMNETVTRIGKDILLTAFVMIFDQKNGQLSYSNASHLDPLILRKPADGPATKQDLIPLMGAKGPRLGHQKQAEFMADNFQLEKGDVFVLWTDGLTEAENPEGKQWGQRNFLKAYLSSDISDAAHMRENIINQLISFNQEHPFEDDVTLICGRWEGK